MLMAANTTDVYPQKRKSAIRSQKKTVQTQQKQSTKARAPSNWFTFAPKDGGFSVLMPNQPAYQELYQTSRYGTSTIRIWQSGESEGVAYLFNHTEWPPELRNAMGNNVDNLFDGHDQSMIKSYGDGIGGTLIDERKASYEGHPGRYILYTLGNDKMAYVRMYLIGRHVITLSATTSREVGKVREETIGKFLNSFKLIPANK